MLIVAQVLHELALRMEARSFLSSSLTTLPSQPVVVNTVPVEDVSPNREHLERGETVMVEKFLTNRCGCDLAHGGCSSTLKADSIETYRSKCCELTKVELNIALLGQLSAFTNTSTFMVHCFKDSYPLTN